MTSPDGLGRFFYEAKVQKNKGIIYFSYQEGSFASSGSLLDEEYCPRNRRLASPNLHFNEVNFANFSKICFLYRFFLILSRKSITH